MKSGTQRQRKSDITEIRCNREITGIKRHKLSDKVTANKKHKK